MEPPVPLRPPDDSGEHPYAASRGALIGAFVAVVLAGLSGAAIGFGLVDIGDDIETKIDALFCHESQLTETGEWFREFLRERAEENGRAAGLRYAEGFRRLTFAA